MSTSTKNITIQSLINNFDFEVLHRGDMKNKILFPSLNRTGIELSSNVIFKKISTLVLWSTNESVYLSSLKDKKIIKERLKAILNLLPPAIVVTNHFAYTDLLLEIAKKYKTVILRTNLNSSQLYLTVAPWINKQLAEYSTIHGTLINIYGIGVLIQGESGIGKSEIAMELIKKGHLFVADDAVDIANIGGKVLGKPNKISNNFIEVRGIGILNVSRMFGVEKIQDSSNVDLIIQMKKSEDLNKENFERVGTKLKYTTLSGTKIATYLLPITPGRKLSELVESAVIDYKLKTSGYNAANEYIRNYRKVMK